MEPDEAIRHSLTLIAEHPQVLVVGRPKAIGESGAIAVEVTFEVNLPNEWRSDGESPSGVRLQEPVRFDFPSGYPMIPPEVSLRPDFTRDLPHIQPWMADGRPVPCIYDGDLAELLHQAGLAAILNQVALWLDRAALGKLIDPEQGWEPVRRDEFVDFVVADEEVLRNWVDKDGGIRFVPMRFVTVNAEDGSSASIRCQLSSDSVSVNKRTIQHRVKLRGNDGDSMHWGDSLALVVWPGKEPSGKEIVCDTYLPETVKDLRNLKKRAGDYGCGKDLDTALGWLKNCLSAVNIRQTIPLAVILLARRPINLIGSESPVELCPYVVEITAPKLFSAGPATPVRPAAHRSSITSGLLGRMAGGPEVVESQDWTLVGAGSVGSKLALHLARAGGGPSVVVDRSSMAPHNAARHALIPEFGDLQMLWTIDKASKLTNALAGLDQTAKPIREDAARMLLSGGGSYRAWSRQTWAVVNTTASLALREAFGVAKSMPARVVETLLFAAGRAGVITVEGPDRNPNTVDLMAEVYAELLEHPSVGSIVFDCDESVVRRHTGQGCGSMTMTLSDGRLSLFAAGAAEYLLRRQREGLPQAGGEILIGRLCDDDLGVIWQWRQIEALTEVRAVNGTRWRVRIHPRALARMNDEASRWPNDETGGVLMGRISDVSRVINVVDVLEAPEDSERSPHAFVLGTKGLRRRIEEYSTAVGWSLYCLGTWHSHLGEGGPSSKDRATARAVALARLTPTVFLIKTPTSFHALALDA